MMKKAYTFHIGCCGFPVRQKLYYEIFSVVEIQQTFYQLPELKTALRWRNSAPEGFEFTIKAPQLITHETHSPTYRRYKRSIPEEKKRYYGSFKPTEEVITAWEEMKKIANILHATIILFQSPPSFFPSYSNIENMKAFFSSIEREDFTLVWEPRGKWSSKEIERVCKDLDLVHCVDPFKDISLYGKIRYYRLHGKTGYKYQYTPNDLEWLIDKISRKITYFMFNNISMFEDARRFQEITLSL